VAWNDDLQPASWRGLPFFVTGTTVRRGRRTVVHEYPYRDVVWVEDLGRGRRDLTFTAFILGDDVLAQQQKLLDACEQPGPGDLVHPALGKRTAALTAPPEFSERQDAGRYIEISFSFTETADAPAYPDGASATQDNTTSATGLAASDTAADYAGIEPALGYGREVTGSVGSTVSGFSSFVGRSFQNPIQSLLQLSGLPGISNLGRFAFGVIDSSQPAVSGSGLFGGGTGPAASAVLQQAAANRGAAVAAAQAAVTSALTVAASDVSDLAAALQEAVSAFAAAAASPTDALRLLGTLLTWAAPLATTSTAGIGYWQNVAQNGTLNLIRRSAVLEMANAAAAYVPDSYADAQAYKSAVIAAFDAEITVAGDAGDDRSYEALRTVRAAVSADLTARGASLSPMITVSRNVPLPSLVLAYQLYQDATRSDELVSEADPVSPLFMPLSFLAEAS
jgi:prophage DNA circulation protein